MGYTTKFEGEFVLDKPLSAVHQAYLEMFSGTRRMKRNASLTRERVDHVRDHAGLPVGPEGAFYVGEGGYGGQNEGSDILNYNSPPKGQPGLWCKWEPTEDGQGIRWNGVEKFYDYVKWLEYLIENFLAPWGYVLEGEVTWQGEERSDMGKLIVKKNKVTAKKAKITY
jgi:hypothetical protein